MFNLLNGPLQAIFFENVPFITWVPFKIIFVYRPLSTLASCGKFNLSGEHVCKFLNLLKPANQATLSVVNGRCEQDNYGSLWRILIWATSQLSAHLWVCQRHETRKRWETGFKGVVSSELTIFYWSTGIWILVRKCLFVCLLTVCLFVCLFVNCLFDFCFFCLFVCV